MSSRAHEAGILLAVWLQHADVSSEELGDLTCEEVVRLLQATDWDAELELEAKLGVDDRACCPAGIGIAREDGHLLRLCPGRAGTLLWHAHFPRNFWQRLFHEPVEVVPAVGMREDAPELARLFFAGDYARLRDRSRRRPVFSTRADQAHR